ncbi:MAG TPA: TolC family protein [Flavobacteriaceae bacterium]|nr:TolC family protein [Flavobacteriaceae bacterium]
MIKYFLSVILSLTFFASIAQKKWTLEECISHALENNISIRQSELELDLADVGKKDAIGNFLPSLNGTATNAWNTGLTQNVTTGVLQTQTTRNSSYSITAGVGIFQGLRNIRLNQRAALAKMAAQYNLDKMKDDIALMVANSYLQILLNKANLEVAVFQNRLTLEQLARTNDLVDAGVLPRGDLLEIRATDANEKQKIAVAENAVQISLISLAQLLLIKDYENFDIADREFEVFPNEFLNKPVKEIIAAAQESRSEVKIAENRVALAQKDLELERSNYYPSLNGFFNYNTRESGADRIVSGGINPDQPTQTIGIVEETGQAVVAPNFAFITEPPLPYVEQLWRNDGISYGVQLNLPIFNGLSVRNNVKRRQIELKNSEYQLEQARLDLESNVYQAFVDVQGALKAYEAAQVALESQELAFQYANDRFDVGLTNAFDFSQSKLRLDNAKIELNRTKFDYIFKVKVLELYFGIAPNQLKL